MDIHRSRFVPFPTSAISALAFSRSSNTGYDEPAPTLRLAVGRQNGNIEIWNPQDGRWVQETVFLGNGRSIDAVLWTQDPNDTDADGAAVAGQHRLFSISSCPEITEWNLATGRVKRRSTGNFSEVWCFAAQPRSNKSERDAPAQDIVAGCGDGTLVLLSTAENDLQFKRFLARVSGKRARCMCVAYQTRDRVVAGFADSVIRIYDTRKGTVIRNMSLGVSVPGAPKTALVWQLKCLPNGDIVSGDSNGEVRIWDGKTYSLSQRITGHDADCIDLVTSADGRTLLSGSIDGKIAIYRRTNSSGGSAWSKASHRRVHSGEVKAMAAYDSPGMSVLVSGGGDVSTVITPLREYGKENIRFLPNLPQRSPLSSTSKIRLVVSWWEKTISIWHVEKQAREDALSESRRPWKLVARINLDGEHHIQTVAISTDGKLLAAATNATVKVFQLRTRAGRDSLAVRKLEVPTDLVTDGARLLEFSPNGKWLLVASLENDVCVARFSSHPTKPKQMRILHRVIELDRRQRKPSPESGFQEYDQILNYATFSKDSRVLVVSDLAGHLDSWVLHGGEDPSAPAVSIIERGNNNDDLDSDSSDDDDDSNTAFFGQHWAETAMGHLLPKLAAMPLIMTFRPDRPSSHQHANPDVLIHANGNEHANAQTAPAKEYRLWIMTSTHEMYEFDILAGRLSDWSRKNTTASLPCEFTKIRDRVMGAIWDVSDRHERLWLYGTSFMCMLNVGSNRLHSAQPRLASKRAKAEHGTAKKRRKLGSGAGSRIKGSDHERPDDSVSGLEPPDMEDSESDSESVDWPVAPKANSGEEPSASRGNDELLTADDRRWWSSFRWGPILGVALLEEEMEGSGGGIPEVVLVERPQHLAQKRAR